jgi:hypothetical protein
MRQLAGADERATPRAVRDVALEKLDCDSEACALRDARLSRLVDREDIKESVARLKPSGPADNTDLLNNNNIDDVLGKLVLVHPSFYHMKFQMIDFAGERDAGPPGAWKVTPTRLGTIDLMRDVVGAGYDTMGVVLNTDKRTGGGVHWFSIFCDFRSIPYTLEYFNSSGNLPMKQVQAWLIKSETALRDAGKSVRVVTLSGMVHQKDSDTECGLYSVYYIYNRLKGVPAERFQQRRIPDRLMTEFRKDCFNGGS